MPSGRAITDGVEEADEPACVTDRLLEPDDFLAGTGAGIVGEGGVLLAPELLVGVGDGEDEEEGEGGAREEGEEGGFGEGVDVVEGEGGGEAELADEVGHYVWVVFWRGLVSVLCIG